ncbi:hypothetical protein H4O20_14295 [Aequorivita sp. 609]|uniref:BsaWI family type II restriction enzyme n=1 Tax=Aequorivita TaxID=153265 RepID=UPI00160E3E2F|nr:MULTISPECIES: BsaWI family type II restriction enzyme [Aequorivita]MBB6682615.1 hypothetical protein [Aequorivita sp. 609]
MLKKTLDLKETLIDKGKNSDINIDSFISLLQETCIKQNQETFTNSQNIEKLYLHAVLISAFFQLTEYSLQNWNRYFEHFKEISKILDIKTKQTEGKILELLVLHTINRVFNFTLKSSKIKAYIANNDSNPTCLLDDTFDINSLSKDDNKRLINNLTVKMKIRGEPAKEVWGDNDLIVCIENQNLIQQFCIISCKVSLRERVYQSVFWSLHSRLEGTGKHIFVTLDKGNNGKSEIGSRLIGEKARKTRNVLESTMDRVYVFRSEKEVNRSQVIKGFKFLEWDLENWAKDFIGTTKP